MRSIPTTMIWEILRRGGLHLILATLAAISLPVLILMALRHDGALDPQDHSMLVMHIIIVNNCILVLGAALFSAQGRISRLYAYPLRTSSIVAWRMLPAMVTMAALVALCIAILNLLFNLGWPIWGPALVAAVAMASVNAFAWLTEKSPVWTAVAMAAVGGVIAFWFKSRYGSTFSDPTHFWQVVTPADSLTMLAMSALAYWVAVKAVARNRRGEPPVSLGWLAWLDRVLDRSTAFGAQFNSPFQAQCWFEWRRKGWVLPAGALFVLLIGLIVWILSDRQAESLVEGFFVGGAILSALGFIAGLLFGNVGLNDSTYEMGHFMATRPLSDIDAARAVLITAAKSVFFAWAIWAAAFGLACCCVAVCGYSEALRFPKNLGWWYFPAALIGPWLITSSLACLGLFGYSKLILQILCVIAAAIIVAALSSKFLLQPPAQRLVSLTVQRSIESSLLLVCALAFAVARSRGLIHSSTIWFAACILVIATILLARIVPGRPGPWEYLLIATFIAVLVSPIAAAPLALSINRHR